MKISLLTFLLFLLGFSAIAQAPKIQWSKCYGGTLRDIAYCTRKVSDGYISVGDAASTDGNLISTTSKGDEDVWIVKFNDTGKIVWTKRIGGTNVDAAYSLVESIDGYVIVCSVNSGDKDFVGLSYGGTDILLFKLDFLGNVIWKKNYGGSGFDAAYDIKQTMDKGYILAGVTNSTDHDVTGIHYNPATRLPSEDVWVIKVDSTGNLLWQKALGGSAYDAAESIQQTKDSNYIVAGFTNSVDYDVTRSLGSADAWVIKLNPQGKLIWQKTLGGSGDDEFYSVTPGSDSGYILTGHTSSNDSDVKGNHLDASGNATYDLWVAKIDTSGTLDWQKCYGGTQEDGGYNIINTLDGGYIIAGYSESMDGDVMGNHSTPSNIHEDGWILKIKNDGTLDWQKCLGGTDVEFCNSIMQTIDSDYLVGGYSLSNDGDVIGNHGAEDFWIVKLSNKPIPTSSIYTVYKGPLFKIYPNPSHNTFTLQYHLSADATVTVTDVAGKEVITTIPLPKNATQTTINAAAWQPGVYFYSVMQNGSVLESGKLVKE